MSKKKSESDAILADTKTNKLSGKIALKGHVICQNKHYFDIKKGDDLSDIPELFYQTLKTEQVI